MTKELFITKLVRVINMGGVFTNPNTQAAYSPTSKMTVQVGEDFFVVTVVKKQRQA